MIWQIPFSNFSDLLPDFTCASAVGNLWTICLGVNILIPFPILVLYLAPDAIVAWPLIKWKTCSLALRSQLTLANVSFCSSELSHFFLIILYFLQYFSDMFLPFLMLFYYFFFILIKNLKHLWFCRNQSFHQNDIFITNHYNKFCCLSLFCCLSVSLIFNFEVH